MEEKQYESQTTPMEYFQRWYQSTQQFQPDSALQQFQPESPLQQFQPESPLQQFQPESPLQYSPMVNALHYQHEPGQYSVMNESAVHKNQYPIQVDHCNPLTAQPTDLPLTPEKGKKRGRPPKQKQRKGEESEQINAHDSAKKAKRTLDRFNGMSVEEVMAKKLPDIIAYDLDILIIGINPGLLSAYKGRHYPNPGNHFWKCLFLSGFTDMQLNHMHDQTLPDKYSIGFTNMVERTTPGSKDLSNKEIREGGRQLLEKLQKYRPRIAAFNGKCIYEIFCKEIFGVKAKNVEFGLQPYKVPDTETVCYLMPSSSPRCAQFPRAQDKVHFYIKLKELRDQIKGVLPNHEIQETQYIFDLDKAKEDAKRMAIKEEQNDPGYEECSASRTQQACSFCPATDRGPHHPHIATTSKGAANSEHSSASENVRSNLTWTMQPFADQIPDIGWTNKDETY